MFATDDPPGGEFMSSGYSATEYPSSKKCTWKIKSNTRIGLYFKTFQTESGYDFVKVYDGESESSTLIGSYSGSTIPPYITSSSKQLYIVFTTDGSNQKKGFSAHFDGMRYILFILPFNVDLSWARGHVIQAQALADLLFPCHDS